MQTGIVERLKDKDSAWQEQCDKWRAYAADMGVLDQWLESEPLIRPTIEAEAAETIATLRREVELARAKHESLKTLTIERSERLREADSRALRLDAEVFDLRVALEPFRAWALDNVELVPGSIDADGEVTNGYYQWKHAPMRELIVDWFGPSDFGAAIRSLADKEG